MPQSRKAAVLVTPPLVEPTMLDLVRFDEPNGSLIAVTGGKELPFPIARVFFLFDVPKGQVRGDHAHRECHQVMMAIQGRVEVEIHDAKENKKYLLDSATKALWVPPMFWARQRYLDTGTLLTVFTDQPYSESDYIRKFSEFQKLNLNPVGRK